MIAPAVAAAAHAAGVEAFEAGGPCAPALSPFMRSWAVGYAVVVGDPRWRVLCDAFVDGFFGARDGLVADLLADPAGGVCAG